MSVKIKQIYYVLLSCFELKVWLYWMIFANGKTLIKWSECRHCFKGGTDYYWSNIVQKKWLETTSDCRYFSATLSFCLGRLNVSWYIGMYNTWNIIFRNINKRSFIQCIEKVVKIAIAFSAIVSIPTPPFLCHSGSAKAFSVVMSHQNVKFIYIILYQSFFSWAIIWNRGLWLSHALFENCGNCGGRKSHQLGWLPIV